jgi:hypothetical protein
MLLSLVKGKKDVRLWTFSPRTCSPRHGEFQGLKPLNRPSGTAGSSSSLPGTALRFVPG